MTATTNVTVERDTWTEIGGASPTAIMVSSNMDSSIASWRFGVFAAPPSLSDIGHRMNAKDSISLNNVTGQCYVLAENVSHQFAVTT